MTKRPAPLRFLSPIHKATRQVGRLLEGPCRALGLAPAEGHLVAYLAVYGPCPVGEVRRVFGLKGSTLTHRLDRLQRLGHLTRTPHATDRRSWILELTSSGREVATVIRRHTEALETAIRCRITHQDLEGWQAVLEAIADLSETDVLEEIPES